MNARDWLAAGATEPVDVAVLGAPISKASIRASQAWSTPPAFRGAVRRFATWDATHGVDVAALRVRDLGDVAGDRDDADASAAHARIERAVAAAAEETISAAGCVVVIGGDNSLTRPAMRAAMAARPSERWGLITLDAHHDCRPLDGGSRNGTPVRELIEGGLPGERVAQIGIAPFANERDHARWAEERGVHVYTRNEVASETVGRVVVRALGELDKRAITALYVDFDIDVVDRAHAPACPASMPGGLTPADIQAAASLLGADARVAAVDVTEVDAMADVNETTVRLAAAVFMSFCAGIALRAATSRR